MYSNATITNRFIPGIELKRDSLRRIPRRINVPVVNNKVQVFLLSDQDIKRIAEAVDAAPAPPVPASERTRLLKQGIQQSKRAEGKWKPKMMSFKVFGKRFKKESLLM